MNDDRTDETTWLQVLKPMVFFRYSIDPRVGSDKSFHEFLGGRGNNGGQPCKQPCKIRGTPVWYSGRYIRYIR